MIGVNLQSNESYSDMGLLSSMGQISLPLRRKDDVA